MLWTGKGILQSNNNNWVNNNKCRNKNIPKCARLRILFCAHPKKTISTKNWRLAAFKIWHPPHACLFGFATPQRISSSCLGCNLWISGLHFPRMPFPTMAGYNRGSRLLLKDGSPAGFDRKGRREGVVVWSPPMKGGSGGPPSLWGIYSGEKQ